MSGQRVKVGETYAGAYVEGRAEYVKGAGQAYHVRCLSCGESGKAPGSTLLEGIPHCGGTTTRRTR